MYYYLTLKFVSSLSRVSFENLTTGNLSEEEWKRVTSSINIFTESEILIDDVSTITPKKLIKKLIELKNKYGKLGMIVIDCLQNMAVTKNNETLECLRKIPKDFDCPIIVTSQLNKNLEQRPNKRPLLSDFQLLKNTENIDDISGTILFIYRDEMYNECTKDKGIAEIIVAKHRNGQLGTVRLHYDCGQFDNYTIPVE